MPIHCKQMNNRYTFIEDYEAVMERLGGNPLLLDKLLRKFFLAYRNTHQELDSFIGCGKLVEAHRLVHSIKGVSGNLGLSEVYRQSVALDLVMKDGSFDPAVCDTALFTAAMDSLISMLETVLESDVSGL